MKRRSHWSIHHVARDPLIVWIIDLDDGGLSVTNDANHVCRDLNEQYPGCRILYRDTMGNWDEIVHYSGRFVGFRAGGGARPPRERLA